MSRGTTLSLYSVSLTDIL